MKDCNGGYWAICERAPAQVFTHKVENWWKMRRKNEKTRNTEKYEKKM